MFHGQKKEIKRTIIHTYTLYRQKIVHEFTILIRRLFCQYKKELNAWLAARARARQAHTIARYKSQNGALKINLHWHYIDSKISLNSLFVYINMFYVCMYVSIYSYTHTHALKENKKLRDRERKKRGVEEGRNTVR